MRGLLKEKYTRLRLSSCEEKEFQQMPRVSVLGEDGSTTDLPTNRLRSVWTAPSGEHFHLHPELVSMDSDDEAHVHICPPCSRALDAKPPRHAIAAGHDFGLLSRLGLELPSPLEAMALAEGLYCGPDRI